MAFFSLKDDAKKGNESDEHNIANDEYNEKFNSVKQAEEAGQKGTHVDTHGDKVQDNYNSDGEETDDVQDQEENAAAAKRIQEESDKDARDKQRKDDAKKGKEKQSRFKGSGSTIATGGILVFIGGILISMASGSSFWVALEKQLTNDGADDSRLNSVMHRAFNNQFDSCNGKLVCKMKTMSKTAVSKLKNGYMKVKGVIVGADGKPVAGSTKNGGYIDASDLEEGQRVKPSELEFDTGKTVNSGATLTGYTNTDIHARAMQMRVTDPMKTDFLNGKFEAEIDAKYKISKAKATSDEEKTNNAEEGAGAAAKKGADVESGYTSVGQGAKQVVKSMLDPDSTFQLAAKYSDYFCTAYNMVRIAVGAVKAKWALDLIRYAYPYLRLIAKIADGSATDKDFAEIEQRLSELTDYLSITKAEGLKQRVQNDTLTDDDKALMEQYGIKPPSDKLIGHERTKQDVINDIDHVKNKNAFDSQGLRAVMYGDGLPLSDFARQFNIGAIGTAALGADWLINQVNGIAGGLTGDFGKTKDGRANMKSYCKLVKSTQSASDMGGAALSVIECLGTGWQKCVGKLLAKGAAQVLISIAKSYAIRVIGGSLLVTAMLYFIPKLPSFESGGLKGPAIGDTIASGVALLLAHKSQGSGLKPALSRLAVGAFIANTQDVYDKYGTEVAQYNARSTPFDVNNPYSFIGMIMAKINPMPVIPGRLPNAFGILSNVFNISASIPSNTALALHSSPSLMTTNNAALDNRLMSGVCEHDTEKREEGMMCDKTSGRAINIASPRVIQWANEDASGKSHHLEDIVNWMQKEQPKSEGPDEGSGTDDETCNFFINLLNADLGNASYCSDSSKKSIDEDGNVQKGSQFEMFLKYCTDQRELEIGSTSLDNSEGSDKYQDWVSGKQCGQTYDMNGKSSSSSDFDPSKDTGKGSYMMDAFVYYYNMCYVQYSMANDATDCTNDKRPGAKGGSSGSASVGAGNGSIVDSANMMGKWGEEFNACYKQQRGHDTAWMDRAIENHFTGEYAVDCSEFVRAVVYHATGNDPGSINTMTMCGGNPNFEKIPRSEAKPGDFAIDDACVQHTEVIVAINPDGSFQTVGSHSDGCGVGKGASPGTFQGGSYVVRYKGPTSAQK